MSIIFSLFAILVILNHQSGEKKIQKNDPYGTAELKPSTIDTLDDKNYQNIVSPNVLSKKIQSGKPVFAYLFSPECPHCQNFTPNLMKKSKALNVYIDQLNILEYNEAGNTYKVEGTPTLIYFNKGKEVNRLVGDYSDRLDELTNFLKQAK